MMRKGKLVNDVFGPSIEGPADAIVNDAWEAETPAQRVKLARKALSIDINAIDAYNILGIHAPTVAEKIALFREAEKIGESLFAPLLDDGDMEWWGFLGTRPWMRARQNLGIALLDAGDSEEAIAVFKSLIALNPNDNQGVRYILLRLLAQTGHYDDCKILVDNYAGDSMIEFPATKLLIELARPKPRKSLDTLLYEINTSNPHFLKALKKAAVTQKWPQPSRSAYISMGSPDQANSCVCEFREAWTRIPGILERFLAMPEIQAIQE